MGHDHKAVHGISLKHKVHGRGEPSTSLVVSLAAEHELAGVFKQAGDLGPKLLRCASRAGARAFVLVQPWVAAEGHAQNAGHDVTGLGGLELGAGHNGGRRLLGEKFCQRPAPAPSPLRKRPFAGRHSRKQLEPGVPNQDQSAHG